MSDSEKAAQEIFDNIRPVGEDPGWTMISPNKNVMDPYEEKALVQRIRQIIDKHLC